MASRSGKLAVIFSAVVTLLFHYACKGSGSGVNTAPEITSQPYGITESGSLYTYPVVCGDADSDILTLSVSGNDTCGGSVTDSGDGTGTYSVTPGVELRGQNCTMAISCSDAKDTAVQSKNLYVKETWPSENSIRISMYTDDLDANLPASAPLIKNIIQQSIDYLQERFAVVRLASNLVVSGTACGEYTVPVEHRSVGLSNADVLMYVTASGSLCTGTVTAYASTCEYLTGTGRPVVGYINICSGGELPVADNEYSQNRFFQFVTHELMHALGFNTYIFENQSMTMIFSERGHSVRKITTSSALEKVREYTGCPTLNGVEMEDQGGAGSEYSHLESRIFAGELMAGTICSDPPCPMTAVTMAIMEDTGWYTPNYNKAEVLWRMKNRGCDFAADAACDSWYSSEGGYGPFFCQEDTVSCNSERSHVSLCSYTDWGSALPSYYQYFSGSPTVGGGDMLPDYCPSYRPVSTIRCKDEEDATTDTDMYGATFGTGSRCLSSTLWDQETAPNVDHYGVHCYSVENCQYNGRYAETYDVRIMNKSGDDNLVSCNYEGAEITVDGYTGSLVCAPPREVCSDLQ